MPFDPNNTATYTDASDAEILKGTRGGWRPDIILALQTELLRRNIARMSATVEQLQLLTTTQAEKDEARAKKEFRFVASTTALSILIASAAFYVSWKMNSDAVRREASRQKMHAQTLADDIQWEIGIDEVECENFRRNEKQVEKNLGSPVWIAQTNQIRRGLQSDLFTGNARAIGALETILYDLNALNERNHLMASAAVDNLPEKTKEHFLQQNLRLYSSNCADALADIATGRPTILKQLQKDGLRASPIDVTAPEPMHSTFLEKFQ
ncbi:MAG: hypothetical protein KGM24_00835 [Elusimicrobia bacterium]|nr:hypothetical protein [Elusimicrobiota bacterium]